MSEMAQTFKDCKSQHIVIILKECIFPSMKKPLGDKIKNGIIKYIETSELTVTQILNMNRKEFSQNIVQHSGDKKLKAPSAQIYTAISKFTDFDMLYNKKTQYTFIIEALQFYEKIKNSNFQSKTNKDMIQKYFADKSKIINLLNEYHKTVQICKTREKYEETHAIIVQSVGKCNVSKCKGFKRNHRIINDEDEKKSDDNGKLQFYKDTLDKLHCYFLHGFDSGMRVHSKEMKKIMQSTEIQETEQKIMNSSTDTVSSYDASMDKLNKNIKQKTKQIQELKSTDTEVKNKFFTEAQKEDEKVDESQKRFGSYSFGHRYYYWDEYKLNEQPDYGPNIGFKKKYWYIDQKYKDLQEEILQNNIFALDKSKYDSYVSKAETNMNCYQAKGLKIDSIHSEIYRRKTSTPVSVNNLLTIILYTDESDLCYHFSSTFRKQSNETNKEMKNRNSEYYNFSRILHETVELYGTPICNSTVPIYYHGVSYMTFASFISHFCGPTSTTAHKEVAINFSKDSGIILKLVKENDFSCLKLFDCSWISRFTLEDERLFIGGDKPLRFASIYLVREAFDCVKYVRAFTMLDYAIKGHSFEAKGGYDKIRRLLQHLDPRINYETTKDHPYAIDLFKTFCYSKKQITINLEIMNSDYPGLKDDFLLLDCEYLPTIDYLAVIFKNCETMNIYSNRVDLHAMDANSIYLSNLLWMCNELNVWNVQWLTKINIYNVWNVQTAQFKDLFSQANCKISVQTEFMETDSCVEISRNYVK